MTKVVYNACYGGFSLSKEACQRYWEIKGQQVWIEDERWGFEVWLVPPEERLVRNKNWDAMSMDERIAYNKAYSAQTWYNRDVDRHDPALVQVVEELGDKANGECAKLAIEEISGPYRIDEYDGYESVETPDGYDWIIP
jgi:hypothetical protein